MNKQLLFACLLLSQVAAAEDPGMTIIFTGGTGTGSTAGASITVVNPETGVSKTNRVGSSYTSSGCATVLARTASEAGLKTKGVGISGIRVFGAGVSITITGECPYRCSPANCT